MKATRPLVVTLATLTLAAPAAGAPPAHTTPQLSVRDAKRATRLGVAYLMVPFTESRAIVRVRHCDRRSRRRVDCRARVTGDRLTATLTSRVRLTASGGYDVRFASLNTDE